MKKNNFLEGSFIATLGIVVCKIIGLIYVIPFYALITTKGATLYSFAYSIYAVFLSLSTSGIPYAMSKMVSEYNSLEYYHTKEKVYKLGFGIIMFLGVFFFLVMMITAPYISNFILGNNEATNINVGEVTLVIRLVSTALLVVPLLSVTKGYLQGHKIMTPPSISNVLEQIVRVIVILGGCYISLKIMHVKENIAIGISVFAATVGALAAYLYLAIVIKKNKNYFHKKATCKNEELKYTSKLLVKQIVLYSLPFIIIDLLKSSYNLVDTLTIVRTLTSLGYSGNLANTTFSVIATWGNKLSMIIISISMGISISLIPSLASNYVLKKKEAINHNVNQAIQALLYITIPMTLGLWFLARPVWIIFYSYDAFSIEVFKVFIFQAITFSLFSVLLNITQTTNHTKVTILTLFISFLGNALLNIPMMHLMHNAFHIGYQGASVATLITQILPSIYLLYFIHKKLEVNYKSTYINVFKICVCTLIMFVFLILLSLVIPIDALSKGKALIQTILYSSLGAIIYFITSYKCGLFNSLFSGLVSRFKPKKDAM